MPQEDLARSMIQLNDLRRGSNKIALAKLAASATGVVALVVAGVVVQQNRSDNNERQGEARQEDQRQASGGPSDGN